MTMTIDRLERDFARTDGHCHLCGRRLAFQNYGTYGARGAWHREHSVPRARGGTEHGNNVRPACIVCNLEKGTRSTRCIRTRYNRTAAPYSRARRQRARVDNAIVGAVGTFLVAKLFGADDRAALWWAAGGSIVGYQLEPDPQRR